MTTARLTSKQREILFAIIQKRDDGKYCDVYDIMEKVSYEATRSAIVHSLQILENKGFIERLPKEKRKGPSGATMALAPFDLSEFGKEQFGVK